MNYMTIREHDIANGPGIRVTLFVCGCRLNCKNCFNKEQIEEIKVIKNV